MRRHELIGNLRVSQRADGGQHKRFVNARQKLLGSSNPRGFHDEISFCQSLVEFCFGNETNTEGAALAVGIDIADQRGELVIYQPHDVAPNGTKTQQQNLHTTHSSQCRCTPTGRPVFTLVLVRLEPCAQISLDSEPSFKPAVTTRMSTVLRRCQHSRLATAHSTLRCDTTTKFRLARRSPKPMCRVKTLRSRRKYRAGSMAITKRKPRSFARFETSTSPTSTSHSFTGRCRGSTSMSIPGGR